MKSYKDFNKVSLGGSDIASLVFRGASDVKIIRFGSDGCYAAYFVTEKDATIGEHYYKVATFNSWLTVYDDDGKVFDDSKHHTYDIYRAGDFGIIIHAY